MTDHDVIAEARAFVEAGRGADVEIFIRNGATAYKAMLDGAPDLIARLCARIAELENEWDESRGDAGRAHGQAGALHARVIELRAQVAARDARIAELEARVGRLTEWHEQTVAALRESRAHAAELDGELHSAKSRIDELKQRIVRSDEAAQRPPLGPTEGQLRIVDRAIWVDHGDGNMDGLTGVLPIWADEWAWRIVDAVNDQSAVRPPLGYVVARQTSDGWNFLRWYGGPDEIRAGAEQDLANALEEDGPGWGWQLLELREVQP